jgi:hypothetical protein
MAHTKGNPANSPVITSIRRGPGGWAEWLVSIEGVCTDTHFRKRAIAEGGAS